MQNLKILNSRETKRILEKLEDQYGFDSKKAELGFIFLMNKDNRLYILSKDVSRIELDSLKIDSLGLYFGELYKESIRLSIEGAQIVGKIAIRNIIEINHEQMLEWIKGHDIEYTDCGKDFVIVKCKNGVTGKEDILGCGKYKDGKLMNYVSKSRRLVVVNE
jgi:NOL1/NOP2/fmu family ribosome biogenesis protein